MRPLEGFIVLDFSQYLAGPSAALRLGDLGARVIKVERPKGGDSSRAMTLHNLVSEGDSVLFQTINRGKESFAANLKDPGDLTRVRKLIQKADVLIENFRPGVMDKLGLGYEAVHALNPGLVYATVTGYGTKGPWAKKPGQDLLVQSMSGVTWLNGDDGCLPVPFALSVADSYTGVHLAEGVMACLFRRATTGEGGRVEVSLLESILDMQFEFLTTYLNDGHKPPKRSAHQNACAYLGAPYGIYRTTDGYIALAMGSVTRLGEILGIEALDEFSDPQTWFSRRDEIKKILADKLCGDTSAHWLALLEAAGYWCAEVLTWEKMLQSDGFKALDMIQNVGRPGSGGILTPRCPITVDCSEPKREIPAPALGADTDRIVAEFGLDG